MVGCVCECAGRRYDIGALVLIMFSSLTNRVREGFFKPERLVSIKALLLLTEAKLLVINYDQGGWKHDQMLVLDQHSVLM